MIKAAAPGWNPDGRLTPGTTSYYLARFCPPDRRAEVALLLAWHDAINDIRRLSDAGVALAKLHWWHGELDRALAGDATHPLAVALGEMLKRNGISATEAYALLDALDAHLHRPGYRTAGDVAEHHRAAGGSLGRLLARLDDRTDASAAADCGAFFAAVDVLRQLGAEIRTINPLVADATLAAHGIAALPAAPAASALLVRTLCDEAQLLRPTSTTSLPRPLSGMLALADTLLGEIRRSDATVLTAALDLPPLRKLWIVWRSR